MDNKTKECSICWEQPKGHNKLLICPSCEITVCSICVKQYIMNQNILAHCSKCNTKWSYKILNTISKSWVTNTSTGYRFHQKKIALDREKSKIPKTLLSPELQQFKNKQSAQKTIQTCKRTKKGILVQIKDIDEQLNKWETESELDDLLDIKNLHLKTLYRINRSIDELKRIVVFNNNKSNSIYTKNVLISACIDVKCRGMISSDDYKCVVCEKKVCKKCFEFSDLEHTCDPNSVKNVIHIIKESKPCPKCSTRIYKINGCDQMWCTICHTPFSWRSGRVVHGAIHNPHAHAWFRENNIGGRNIDDVPCGGLIDMPKYNTILFRSNEIRRIHTVIAEINEKLHNNVQVDNFDLFRMRYILGEITEKQWCTKISTLERSNERKRCLVDILTTFRHIGVDYFRNFGLEFREIDLSIFGHGKRNSAKTKLCIIFIKKMNDVKEYINMVFQEELGLLGVKNILQIKSTWVWSDY
uniref:E3 ubiquitin-protein ligase n=1 Tax=Pithovirus LCPAC001 TaxID=2506585 RepID=A0A481Z2C5_9VIRU|nr:MAG: E3 ubiquitin-protein ligase [Pithovirus LCPAC001]